MARKFRNAKSYYGRTEQARKNQRGNLIPGGKWQKRKTEELRLDCFWEGCDLEDKRFFFEGYENNRDLENIPEGKLKSEKFLDKWWTDLEPGSKCKGEGKKFIYWWIMSPLPPEQKDPILKNIQECLKEKLALLKKA